MKVQSLSRPGRIASMPLQLENRAPLTPEPGELLVEVSACAVCRTDLQIVEGDLPARALPVVPGHQVVGHVAAIGDGVAGWEMGDRVGIGWLAETCRTCSYCTSGRENLCESARFTGWGSDGGYAEQAVVQADFALRLPPGRTDLELAPLLCGGVIGYRSLRVSGIRPGERLGLFGFGASASLAIQVAAHWDCKVFVATRSEAEQERARELGATWAGGYDDPMPEPLHAAVTFAPAGTVVVSALERIVPGGAVAINAIHLDCIPGFDYDLLWGERQLRSVANYTRTDAAEFLALAAGIPIQTRIEQYSLSEANTALANLKEGATEGTPVLFTGPGAVNG
jgi:propanol-preferring alcohol dehydrogenase